MVAVLGGCAKTLTGDDITGSTGAPPVRSEQEWRRHAETWGERYRANPGDARAAMEYGQALRAIGQRAQASAVLEQASIRHPQNKALLGDYGRALADTGRFQQALEVLNRAHTPDKPDWRVLSAQGAVLDQLGRHQEAQRYYASALRIHPNDPGVLSNLGLSYALQKDLVRAEGTLRQAAEHKPIDPRVRQNLALVVGLQGRFSEAEAIAGADLPADKAAASVAQLRQMLAQQKGKTTKPARQRAQRPAAVSAKPAKDTRG